MLARLCDDAVRLMPVLCGQARGATQDFFLRQQLLAVARVVRGYLCRGRTVDTLFTEMIFDLLSARAGRLKILFRVTLDLWLPVLATLNFIAQLFEAQRQLRSVNRCYIMLRDKYLVRLQRARLPPPRCHAPLH